MPAFALDEWPDGPRQDGATVCDVTKDIAARTAALRRLREAADSEVLSPVVIDQIHSLFAELIGNDEQPRSITDEATDGLLPVIRRLAERLEVASPGPIALLLRDDAEGLIWQRLRDGGFDPDLGRFTAWCRTVLQNELVTRYRRSSTDPLSRAARISEERDEEDEGTGPAARIEDPRPGLEKAIDSMEFMRQQFSEDDLREIERLQVVDRLLLLSLSGLWWKVPSGVWREWVEEQGAEHPFPPPGFVELETQTERQEWLAAALGLSIASVIQRWYRQRRILARLQCIRSLQP